MSAASEGIGHGTTFTVHFPRVQAHAAEEIAVFDAATGRDVRKRVLVIDDNDDARRSFAGLVGARFRAAQKSAITLVAITGYGQPEDQRRALEAGSDAHFIKPVTLKQLNETLARINTSVRPDPNRAPVPSAILSANRSQAQG